MKKLEKKQIPQFAALCLLSAGLFGYFVVRLVTPSPAAAGTRPVSAPAKPAPAGAGKPSSVTPGKNAALTPDIPANGDEAPVPTPGMHDPFVIGYVDPKTLPASSSAPALPTPGKPNTKMASLPAPGPAFPSAPALQAAPLSLKGFPVQPLPPPSGLPAAPTTITASAAAAPNDLIPKTFAPPAWSVTGVLQSDGGQVAILRSGAARRIVHTGDFVDSVYRVVDVTRSAVVLRHGTAFYHLPLGIVKEATAKSAAAKIVTDAEKPAPPTLPTSTPDVAALTQKAFDTANPAEKPNNFNF